MTTLQQTLDELCVNTIRTLAIDGVQHANSGPPRTSDGRGADGLCAVAQSSAARPGRAELAQPATGSCSARATGACCCMHCCTCTATTSRSTT